MFGRGAADRVVVERAWVLESQLRKLAAVGTAPVPLPSSALRVIAVGQHAGSAEGKILATYLAVALTHTLRGARPGRPWQHTVFVLGADRLRGDTLDRLSDACESTGTGLVLGYRSVPPHVKQRLGRGNAAVAFMRLGNAEDAKAASEQLGTEHRFVLSQLTETVGLSVTDTTTSSYTSTAGSTDSLAASWSTSEGTTRGTGRSRTDQGVLPLPAGALAQQPGQRFAQHRGKRNGQHRDQHQHGLGADHLQGHRRQRVARLRAAAVPGVPHRTARTPAAAGQRDDRHLRRAPAAAGGPDRRQPGDRRPRRRHPADPGGVPAACPPRRSRNPGPSRNRGPRPGTRRPPRRPAEPRPAGGRGTTVRRPTSGRRRPAWTGAGAAPETLAHRDCRYRWRPRQ